MVDPVGEPVRGAFEPTLPSERSVRASFARSWRQLGAVEQRVLSQLALLPGPCARELLRTVLQAPLPVLAWRSRAAPRRRC